LADLAAGAFGLDQVKIRSCRSVLVREGLRPDIHGTTIIHNIQALCNI